MMKVKDLVKILNEYDQESGIEIVLDSIPHEIEVWHDKATHGGECVCLFPAGK